MLDGIMPNTNELPSTEPTTEISSPIVHSHSSLSFNSISLLIVCRCNNDVCEAFYDAENSICIAILVLS